MSQLDWSNLTTLERNFQHDVSRDWFRRNWHKSIYISIVYLLATFSLRAYMKNRSEWKLRGPLILWNALLAVFSIMGTLRVWPEFLYSLQHHGLMHSVCDGSFRYVVPSGFWVHMFAVSKLLELGDTLFVVLRKQKLHTLHWYHHSTVLVFTWLTMAEAPAFSRWHGNVNYLMHSLMYSYYTMRALRLRVPRLVAMFITVLQIIQMPLGIFALLMAWYYKIVGQLCPIEMTVANFALLIYISYFVFFIDYWSNTYTTKNNTVTSATSANNNDKPTRIEKKLVAGNEQITEE